MQAALNAPVESPLPPVSDDVASLEALVAESRARRNQIHPEAKGALARSPGNHCPFGCTGTDLDENGYCHHLVGYAVPGARTMEEQVPDISYDRRGIPYLNGKYRIGNKNVPILPTDKRVNPARIQKIPTGMGGVREELAFLWVNDRIYREREKPRQELAESLPVNEELALKTRIAELEERASRKRLQKRVEELEAELSQEPKEHVKGRK
jgi:hypothetical protein